MVDGSRFLAESAPSLEASRVAISPLIFCCCLVISASQSYAEGEQFDTWYSRVTAFLVMDSVQ